MRKIFPFMMLALGSFFIYSCDSNDDVIVQQGDDYDTYSQMRDITGSLNSSNNYAINVPINISNTDVVLVYRKVEGVWQALPKNYYLNDVNGLPFGRELEYNFVFDTQTVQIRTESNFNQTTEISASENNQYLANQTFRVVLVPASAAKMSNSVDLTDYNAVVKYFNLDASKIKTIYAK